MGNNGYESYEAVCREILNSIEVEDLVKCNDWKKPMKVIGVSENYFVMIQNNFGDIFYSVCEKFPAGHSRNCYTKGSFRIGTDDYIGGYITGYKWDDKQFINKYLDEFETGKTQLSVRRAVDLKSISIKRKTVYLSGLNPHDAVDCDGEVVTVEKVLEKVKNSESIKSIYTLSRDWYDSILKQSFENLGSDVAYAKNHGRKVVIDVD